MSFALFSLAEASHLVGGFLTYRWLGTNGTNTQYRVTLFVYRDCSRDGTGDEVPFDPDIDLCVYTGDKRLYTSYRIKLLNSKKVQPVGNTNCPQVASACLDQGIYETTISLPNSTTGYHLKWERCCRNTQNNLKDESGEAYQGQTYYGFIPPTSIKNSSPYFQDIPVPFICKDDTTTIRNRAVDPDGDSLSYKLVTPWQGANDKDPTLNQCPNPMSSFPLVEYRNGYSAAKPFGNTGIASIDAFNGLTTYLSRITGRFAIAIEVTEWRNGVAISTIRLDLQILVINCTPNNKPSLQYEGGSRVWEIQPGEKKCWDVTASDFVDDDQVITLRAFSDILSGSPTYTGTKATLNPATNANRKSVTSEFCWQPDCDVNTFDTFRVTFEAYDDGCPSKFVNENVLIKVKPVSFAEAIAGPRSVCQNQEGVTYFADKRDYSNRIQWQVTGGTIVGSDTANSVTINWGNATNARLTLMIWSEFGCQGPDKQIPVNLLPAPNKPKISGADTVCVGPGYTYRYNITVFDGTLNYQWAVKDGIIRSTANDKRYIEVSWLFSPNDTTMLVVYASNAQGCRSIADTLYPFPAGSGIPIIEGPIVVCPNNSNIEYKITNVDSRTTYTWSAMGATKINPQSNGIVTVDWGNTGTGWLRVIATNRFGCSDTQQLNITKTHELLPQRPIGDSAFCEFTQNIPYKVDRVSGLTYLWDVFGGNLMNGQGTSSIDVNWGAAGNAYVEVSATAYDPVNQKTCSSKPSRLPVILHPIPSADIFKLDKENDQCQQNTTYRLQTDLMGKIKDGDVFEVVTTPNVIIQLVRNASSNLIEQVDLDLSQFGTYTIKARIISAFGCVGPWDEVEITIHPKPVNTLLTGNDVICFPPKTQYDYQVTGNLNSTYIWTLTGGQFVTDPGVGTDASVKWDTAATNRNLTVLEVSDKGCFGDPISWDIDYDNPAIQALRVTVAPPPALDNQIAFEYQVSRSPIPNGNVIIERRPFNAGAFWKVGESPQNAGVFNDASAEPDLQAYDYRAYMLNRCGDTLYTNAHTTVWLTGEKTGPLSMSFAFTPYFGFENGVERYEIYRQLIGKGGYELYKTYPGETTDSFNNGEDNYGQRFRIKAYELGGNRVSWSNDINLYFEPVFFIPNAFSPNGLGPGQNEVFKPLISGVKSYEFRIFNRWGQKIAEFFDEQSGWDGNFGGSPAPDGVYVYQLQFRDFQDKLYQFSGTIHLIR